MKPPMTRSEEDIGAELAALWAAVSKMASSLMWRTGQEIVVPVPQNKEVHVMKQETVEGMGEMQEIIVVVSDAVERIQQRTSEQIEDVPQFREETAGGQVGPARTSATDNRRGDSRGGQVGLL